jgi:plastocyanin
VPIEDEVSPAIPADPHAPLTHPSERSESMTPHPSTKQRRSALQILIAFLTALVLPLALTGAALTYSSHHHHHARTWVVKVGEESRDQAIQGMAYLPKNIYIHRNDKIRWIANSAEPHTVTFLKTGQTLESTQPFDLNKPTQTGRVGGSRYDGTSYYNSGLMSNASNFPFPAVTHYTLKFPKTGTFTYWCLLHGKAMKGTVHVWSGRHALPYTQRQYDRRSAKLAKWIIRDGYHLWHETAERATNHRVFTGNDDGIAMVMRFIRPTVYIHVGEKVHFKNIGMGAPHTVTFGAEPKDFFPPSGDPKAYAGGDLNSGFMPPGAKFTVTFTKAGTFEYICALHDYMGMVGKVVVKP